MCREEDGKIVLREDHYCDLPWGRMVKILDRATDENDPTTQNRLYAAELHTDLAGTGRQVLLVAAPKAGRCRLSWIGLIMAGGDGTRMAQSGIRVRKPLAPVVGVTLLERNLWMLARAGCRQIAIATSARAAAEEKPFTDDLARRAASIGVVVELLVEERPLGNFGVVTRLSGRGQPVVVVFADNLTTLNLGELVRVHGQSKAALTLAAHKELFRMPYGELRVRPDDTSRLLTYVEKPSYDILISSGIAVISVEALNLVPRGSAFRPFECFQHAYRCWVFDLPPPARFPVDRR